MKFFKKFGYAIILVTLTFVFINGCKTIDDPKAEIYVYELVSATGQEIPVNNAEVTFDLPAGTSKAELLEFSDRTDIDGKLEIDFKYEGIIKVHVESVGGKLTGQGVLILKYDEIYSERIQLI